ncbi:hypothetical protein [uncultured Acinetobacter sp.]|jgi:hypothetical protein|uniref:hypothetical protein n=1 Tax=uncultured Acinetobacter sp. TaxID=165433 RepID=UPI00261A7CFD|nr:hypothetical protein [uncultured Acinetobacter sp.]
MSKRIIRRYYKEGISFHKEYDEQVVKNDDLISYLTEAKSNGFDLVEVIVESYDYNGDICNVKLTAYFESPETDEEEKERTESYERSKGRKTLVMRYNQQLPFTNNDE